MKVPLSVHPVEKDNTETFDIWANGKYYSIDAPIKPYFYSYKDNIPVPKHVEIEKVKAIALSDFKEKIFYKYSFNTRRELVKYRNRFTFEDNIPFVIRNRIDNPDIFTKYAHTRDVKFLFLDIEQYCPPDKLFPDYSDIITAISYCTNDRRVNTIYLSKKSNSDRDLLVKFIEEWRRINPDVVVVYNKSYDLPTIFNRCIRNKINPGAFSKSGRKPYYGGKDDIHIDGVVIYDVYESAKADQSLTGRIPDRKLKTVSNWFGFEETRKPLTPKQISDLKGTRELVDYNRDDVKRLLVCFDVYWQNIEFNANDLKIPLNEAVQLSISDLGLITIGDEYKRLGVISDGTNYYRYPEIYQRNKRNGEKNYQGALVDIQKVGYFAPVYKADYSSLYPSIMASFNFSPDTTTLLEYKKYTGIFSVEDVGNWYVYNIPDETLKKDVVIQVSKEPGFLSTLVAKFLRERSEYKKKWKETGNPIYRALSDNRKLKANGGVYGNMGYVNHPFGYTPIAIATTGIGRECAKLLIDVLNKLYGNCVIETDSVTGDTPIFVRDKVTKEIDIIPIEDLSSGKLRERVDRYEALTRSGWKNINYVYCHTVNKNIYTIKTLGARIDVTEDHSLFSSGREISPRELNTSHILDLYPVTDFGSNNKTLTKNQAWLLGFFISDGTIHRRPAKKTVFYNSDGSRRKLRESRHYDFTIAKKDLKLLQKAQRILNDEFGLPCKIYDTIKSSGCYKLEGWKKEPIEWIRNMCYCKDMKTKKVPKEILNAPIDIVDAFFEGLTDGDGSFGKTKKDYGKWKIDSIFKPLTSGIAYLLDRKGITYNIQTRSDKPHVTGIQTHKPKNFNGKLSRSNSDVYKGSPGKVSKITFKKEKIKVYDISTDDGTFVAGIGRVICHNTDGIYYTTKKDVNERDVSNMLNKAIKGKFGRQLGLSVDVDYYDAGYFYKAKNYVLKKGDKIIYHGVALTSSSHTKMKKELIREIAEAKLSNKNITPIVNKYLKLDFPLDWFAMNVKLGMPISSYKNKNSIACRMALEAEKRFKIKPEVGNQYFYIKSTDGYKLYDIANKSDIDYKYYRDEIRKVVDIFTVDAPLSNIENWI